MKAMEITNEIDTKWVISDADDERLDRILVTVYQKAVDGSLNLLTNMKNLSSDIYASYLLLPTNFGNTKALINIRNDKDNECFRWCHLAYLFPVNKNTE